MKHTKQNKKRSTVVALVVAVACIAALVGATFAWFTDTASTATNKIQAGNLDVDLVMDKAGNGTYTSIADASEVVFGSANSLVAQNNNQDTVWEPGKTQIAYLGVKNAGNLALKYTIELTVKDNGLADALEYAFIEGAKASDMSAVTDWSTLKASATKSGNVTAGTIQAAPEGLLDEIAISGEQGETDYFVLAIHMKEDAGNDYKTKTADIDVTIKATQVEGEYDSFSNTYDEQAKYADNCLTFSSDAAFSLGGKITVSGLQYSTDTATWEAVPKSDSITPINAVQNGDKYYIYLRGDGLTTLINSNTYRSTNLSLNATEGHKVDCSGNIMTLLDYDNPNGVTMGSFAFSSLFQNCTSLATAPSLPAETLSANCYASMFSGCTSLASAPALPAKTLAESCYSQMFQSCTSLTAAPDLPAESLKNASYCYYQMFFECTSLTSAPALPAETLSDGCYYNMFYGCKLLASAPALPASELASGCYSSMFQNCTSLTSAPALPASELASSCYQGMFRNCTSLTSAPSLSVSKLANYCCESMFSGCTKLKVTTASSAYATKIFTCPSTDGLNYSVDDMFANTGGTFTSTPTKGTTYYWYTEE